MSEQPAVRQVQYPIAQIRETEVELHGDLAIFRHWLRPSGGGVTEITTDDVEAVRDLAQWVLDQRAGAA